MHGDMLITLGFQTKPQAKQQLRPMKPEYETKRQTPINNGAQNEVADEVQVANFSEI
jgi:hypothetical protein